MSARALICWLRGHVYPEPFDATWRWSRRARNEFGRKGAAVVLGARARRRNRLKEQRRCRFCVRCGAERKEHCDQKRAA